MALRLERARTEADRARRQCAAVEPENRLVARTLEQQWEEALAAERRLAAEYEHAKATQPVPPIAAEQAAIRRLAADVPALWMAPSTTDQDRQALIRLVVERIVVTVEGTTEAVTVETEWAGGARTRTDVRRPVARLAQLSTYEALTARAVELHRAGHTQVAIAAALNAEGWLPAKRRLTFTAGMVGNLLWRLGIVTRPNQTLAMPHRTVIAWLRRGWIQGRLVCIGRRRLWLIKADAAEIARLEARDHVPRRSPAAPPSPQTP